ncbi:MmgE/PrpD family protein [Actinomadura syzygii]|uniref:MmgE/PrpD family protein n=1 Tax=Actinomadura syzygii TaxID=1427538 RepID=UPI001651CA11|nr:MmgE/PrpD family protein [Actinomadura syzygii]
MDTTTAQLVDFSLRFDESWLTDSVVRAAVDRVVDSVACAIVGYESEPGQIAVAAARGVTCDAPATVFGARLRTTPELAAFANTTMVRTFDWNDGMLAQGGGHPSDMIAAVIAAGEAVHASGRDVLLGITLAYEVLGALGNAAPTRAKGFDQGTFMGVAAALGIGRMLGLDADQLANAVSLAIVPHVPLRVNRTGLLSMWKGSATASAMHSAIFAVRLARLGMTGPAEPFEGKTGVFDQTVGPFEAKLPANDDGRLVVEISHLKQFPAETHGQALLGLMPRVREWRSVDQIESIRIEAYWQAYHEIAMHPSKWDPTTRETADHSMPYLLAAALVDGGIDVRATFTPERIADPALRPIMNKVSVTEDKAFTAGFRPPGKGIAGEPRMRLIVTAVDGATFIEEVGYHRGHSLNPMSRAEIDAKLDATSAGVLSDERREAIRAAWWAVADAPDICEPMAATADFGADKEVAS